MNYLIELVERGVHLRTLFAVGTTTEGEQVARKLGFEEVRRGWDPLGDERVALQLDLNAKPPKSVLVGRYQAAIKNQKRRARRYEQQRHC